MLPLSSLRPWEPIEEFEGPPEMTARRGTIVERSRSCGGRERVVEGLVPLGGVIPMVGEQCRLLRRPLPECGLEVTGDPAVEVAALLGQQTRLGRFLRQRVLEDVLTLGRGGKLSDQLRAEQVGQGAVQLGRLVAEGAQRAVPKVSADHRGVLEERLGRGGQPIDARADHPAKRGRDRPLLGGAPGCPAIALAPEHAFLDQPTDDLLEEERISLRARENSLADRLWKVRDAQQVVGQSLAVLGGEGSQPQLSQPVPEITLGMEAERPGITVSVRTARHQEHDRLEVGELEQQGQEVDRGWIGPVQIFYRYDHRTPLCESLEQRADSQDELGLERARVAGYGLSLARAEVNSKQVSQGPLTLRGLGPAERPTCGSELSPSDGCRLSGPESQGAAENLDDRRVARALRIGLTASLEPAKALGEVLALLDLQARLPDPGLAHDGDYLAAAAPQVLQAGRERGQLTVPAHDGG